MLLLAGSSARGHGHALRPSCSTIPGVWGPVSYLRYSVILLCYYDNHSPLIMSFFSCCSCMLCLLLLLPTPATTAHCSCFSYLLFLLIMLPVHATTAIYSRFSCSLFLLILLPVPYSPASCSCSPCCRSASLEPARDPGHQTA